MKNELHNITPIILAGGLGKRLWPLSRKYYPKPFISFGDEHSLLQKTILRYSKLGLGSPIILTSKENEKDLITNLKAIDCTARAIIIEPETKNTAASIISAIAISDEFNELDYFFVTPCDHHFANNLKLKNAIISAYQHIENKFICAFGVKQNEYHSGYGYVSLDLEIDKDIFLCKDFYEKPSEENFNKIKNKYQIVTNTGIYLFHKKVFLENAKKFASGIYKNAIKAANNAKSEQGIYKLTNDYKKCLEEPVEKAIFEHSNKMIISNVNSYFRDLGSWYNMWEVSFKDSHNTVVNQANLVKHYNANNSYILSNGPYVLVEDVDNLIIVATEDAVLVKKRNKNEHYRDMNVFFLNESRKESKYPTISERSWGNFKVLFENSKMMIKELTLYPGKSISTQYHENRSEHWYVTSGEAKIVTENKQHILNEGQGINISPYSIHQIINNSYSFLKILEIQSGDLLNERDIVRFFSE